MDTNSLTKASTEIETELREALSRQAAAEIAQIEISDRVTRLEAIVEAEQEAASAALEAEDDDAGDDDLDENAELIKMETKAEKLKYRLSEAEDKAEVEFRGSGAKATDQHVKAVVGSNADVIRLRDEYLDAKEAAKLRQMEIRRERTAAREEAMRVARESTPSLIQTPIETENSKLLAAAEDALLQNTRERWQADIDVEVARFKVKAIVAFISRQ